MGEFSTKERIRANRQHKDSLFRFIFGKNKENALSLYNAVNGTNYTNADDLEYSTLQDVIYIKMKNDVSFVFDCALNLYEHQSSYNPNMPLRGFFYFAELYQKLIPETESLYGQKRVIIPTPRYIVFYNGSNVKMEEEQCVQRLSDSFMDASVGKDFEWTATMININYGKNKELMERCQKLKEYAILIAKIREYNRSMELIHAIDKAVEECIQENVLRDFLEKHRREVCNMCLTEFNEERYTEIIKEEGREEGCEIGKLVTKISLIKSKHQKSKNVSEIADAIETDTAFVQKVIELLEEHPGKDDIQLAELLLNMK